MFLPWFYCFFMCIDQAELELRDPSATFNSQSLKVKAKELKKVKRTTNILVLSFHNKPGPF